MKLNYPVSWSKSPSWRESAGALYDFKTVAFPPGLSEILTTALSNFLLGRLQRNAKEQAETNLKEKKKGLEVRWESEEQHSVNLSKFTFQLRSELSSPCEIRQNKNLPTQVPGDCNMQRTLALHYLWH